jgi:hypothetical protein
MNGSVAILNVGAGDIKLSFDKSNPAERIRAARIVKDMLRRGFALLVEVEPGKYQRAVAFDEDACEYIIADFDPTVAAPAEPFEEHSDAQDQDGEEGTAAAAPSTDTPQKRRRRPKGSGRRRLPAESTKTVAVAKSAGG